MLLALPNLEPTGIRLVCWYMLLLNVVGCDQFSVNVSEQATIQSNQLRENENTRVLRHDFGVIVGPIKKELTHNFEILNDSKTIWTLQEIVNSCSCTVMNMNKSTIKPGEVGVVSVTYKPVGDGSFNDERRTQVVFQGDTAPRFILYVKSHVREPLAIQPTSVVFPRIGEGQSRKKHIEVINYSEEDWGNPEISKAPPWLTTTCQLKPVLIADTGKQMRQRWSVEVIVNTTGLTHGEHSSKLQIEALGDTQIFLGELPVKMLVATAVSAIPTQLFFGDLEIGKASVQTLKLRFTPETMPQSAGEIHFQHPFGDDLQYNWQRIDETTWELKAVILLKEKPTREQNESTISFTNKNLRVLNIPIYVFVEDKTQSTE